MYAGNGQKKYNKLCPRKKDTKIRGEKKRNFKSTGHQGELVMKKSKIEKIEAAGEKRG